MAFDLASSGKRQRRPQMNVTPLVDVVLVLLIIFMVVTPMMTRRFWVDVPVKEEQPAPPPPGAPVQLVLRLARDGTLRLNQEEIAAAELKGRLERVFGARSDRVLFFDADPKAPYGRAVEAMDLARGGGALTIAVITRPPATAGTP
jgi:biopolymer transport protein ExbD